MSSITILILAAKSIDKRTKDLYIEHFSEGLIGQNLGPSGKHTPSLDKTCLHGGVGINWGGGGGGNWGHL